MTDDRMTLIGLIEKGADADLVSELLAFAAEHMMDLEVEAKTGAPAGARSPDSQAHRNGYRERAWETRVGRIELAIPRLKNEVHRSLHVLHNDQRAAPGPVTVDCEIRVRAHTDTSH